MTFNQKEYQLKWYQKNKDKIRKKAKIYYQLNREKIIAKSLKYTIENPEKYTGYRKKLRRKRMQAIFDLLGNKCDLCGITNKVILQIDHIHGGGTQHFKKEKGMYRYYETIRKSITEKEGKYQLLCANCNISEGVRKGFKRSVWVD